MACESRRRSSGARGKTVPMTSAPSQGGAVANFRRNVCYQLASSRGGAWWVLVRRVVARQCGARGARRLRLFLRLSVVALPLSWCLCRGFVVQNVPLNHGCVFHPWASNGPRGSFVVAKEESEESEYDYGLKNIQQKKLLFSPNQEQKCLPNSIFFKLREQEKKR